MALVGVSLTRINDRAEESAEQDQIMYVQTYLALHYPQNKCMVANDRIRPNALTS